MRKIVILFVILMLSSSLINAQDTTSVKYMINRVVNPNINLNDQNFIKLTETFASQIEQNVKTFEKQVKDSGDSLYNSQVYSLYVTAIKNLSQQVSSQFLVNDTVPVYVIDNQYYLKGSIQSIQDQRETVKSQYDGLVKKWGEEKVKNTSQGKTFLEQINVLDEYIKYLKEQK